MWILIAIASVFVLGFVAWAVELCLLAGNDFKVHDKNLVVDHIHDKHVRDSWMDGGPLSFCSVFWGSLGTYFTLSLGVCMASLLTGAFLYGGFQFFFGVTEGDQSFQGLFFLITTLTAFFSAVIASVLGYEYAKSTDFFQGDPDKEPNKVIAGMKAWYQQHKDKWCPTITK